MARYRVIHRDTGEVWEVEAASAEEARRAIGWRLGDCRVVRLEKGPFRQIEPPRVAVQITPPIPGTGYICPDCRVTLTRSDRPEWWFCPSCELLFHAGEERYYREDELTGDS